MACLGVAHHWLQGIPVSARPNPSLERTRTGMALGPRGAGSYHPPRGPSTTPALAAQLKRLGAQPEHRAFNRRTCMAKPSEPLPPEVLAAFQRRQPIEAIKLLLASGASTAQQAKPPAKRQPGAPTSTPKAPVRANVESIASGGGLSPGEVPRSSSAFWAWCIVALFAYLAYRLVRG